MASIDQPILTIAIPTFNRAEYLNRCLEGITSQIKNKDYKIELIISDNCSSDNTSEIVERYIQSGIKIRYIRNKVNMGMDLNFAQCYIEAKGKYVVAFGDDDLFLPGSIDKIIDVLLCKDYGVVFLKSKVLREGDIESILLKETNFVEYNNPINFIKKINYYITFISANIINTKYLDQVKLLRYQGTHLLQVSYILDAALNGNTNIYFEDCLIAAEPDNTGGYSLFKVFGESLFSILIAYDNTIQKILKERLLLDFFPYWILHFKSKKTNFNEENPLISLKKVFGNHTYYKIFIYPLVKLPLIFAKVLYRIIKIYDNLIYKK